MEAAFKSLAQVKKFLDRNTDANFSVLQWNDPKKKRPREESYVLIKHLDQQTGVGTCDAAYEKGEFWFSLQDGTVIEFNEKVILGWDYYPYNENCYDIHCSDKTEEPLFKK